MRTIDLRARRGSSDGGASFGEEPRREAALRSLATVRRLGIRCRPATGDAHATAVVPALVAAVDAQLGVLPEDKVRRVRECGLPTVSWPWWETERKRRAAWAGADLGVALGSATDLTRTTADVAVLRATIFAGCRGRQRCPPRRPGRHDRTVVLPRTTPAGERSLRSPASSGRW